MPLIFPFLRRSTVSPPLSKVKALRPAETDSLRHTPSPTPAPASARCPCLSVHSSAREPPSLSSSPRRAHARHGRGFTTHIPPYIGRVKTEKSEPKIVRPWATSSPPGPGAASGSFQQQTPPPQAPVTGIGRHVPSPAVALVAVAAAARAAQTQAPLALAERRRDERLRHGSLHHGLAAASRFRLQ